MLLERIYDEDLAQASYFIGCQAQGEALVVDPRRDINVYLDLAAQHDMRITGVTETHIHADYLSGTLELAAHTGATVYVSDEGGPEWVYGSTFDGAVRMKHGDTITLGNITVKAVHTPGHTPEHLSFLITDGALTTEPGFMLTGDFVFVGDLGRPDLLDEAAGYTDTRFIGARDLFTSLKQHFITLPDYVQVLPGHGSGSACGKALGAIAATTVGYERNFAWWAPYLAADDEQGFIEELLDGQPDAHAYFARMKEQNKTGPALLPETSTPRKYEAPEVKTLLEEDRAILVDTRHNTQVHEGTVAGALNIPGPDKAATYAGWVVNPETEQRPLILLADTQEEASQMRDHLVRVGIDTVAGYITSFEGLTLIRPDMITPEQLPHTPHDLLLDVRNATEYAEGHLPGAQQLSAGRIMWHHDTLPNSGTIISYCQSGVRNSVAASALRRKGYSVIELEGSYAAWSARPGNIPVRA